MSAVWIFGYGSLIWRPDFPYLERRRARIHGWQRRFWQGSHDHRGVPERPGRVVTLVETGHGHCDGMAYKVDMQTAERTFEALDHREKNGYLRRNVTLDLAVGAAEPSSAWRSQCERTAEPSSAWRSQCERTASRPRKEPPGHTTPAAGLPAIVYIAATDNHAYLGPAPLPDMARQIVTSTGPSGPNLDYLLELAEALRVIEADDPHVFELEAAAREYPR